MDDHFFVSPDVLTTLQRKHYREDGDELSLIEACLSKPDINKTAHVQDKKWLTKRDRQIFK